MSSAISVRCSGEKSDRLVELFSFLVYHRAGFFKSFCLNYCLTFPENPTYHVLKSCCFFLLQLKFKLNFECLFIFLHHSVC